MLKCVLLSLLVLLACPVSSAQLRIGVAADISSMDPHFANFAPNVNISTHVFETLTRVDENARLIPGLAESWRALNETTWEFKLRPGVRFHDGSQLTAEDVIYSLERPTTIRNSPGGFATFTRPIVAHEIVDPFTVRLKTAASYAMLPYDLNSIFIVSKRAANGATSADFDSGRAMLGTGPYRFVRFARGDRVELERYEGYWGPKPQWDKVTLRIMTSDPTRIAALLAGDLDLIEHVPPADVTRLRADTRFHVEEKVSWRTIFFILDQGRGDSPFIRSKGGEPIERNPFQDVRVRRAISKAINRRAIATRLMEGLALPTANIVAPPIFGHVAQLEPEIYDPQGARELLAEAGYPDGFMLTVHAPNNRYVNDEQIAQAVAQMLARIGIAVRVETMPVNVYLPKGRAQAFSFAMLGWGSFSADLALRSLLMTANTEKGTGAWNWGRYSNPQVDALVTRALGTLDNRKREDLARQAVRLAMTELAFIPVHHQIATWAMRRGLTYTARTDEFTFAFDVRPNEASADANK